MKLHFILTLLLLPALAMKLGEQGKSPSEFKAKDLAEEQRSIQKMKENGAKVAELIDLEEEFCGYVTPKNMKILRLLQSAIFRRQALLDGKFKAKDLAEEQRSIQKMKENGAKVAELIDLEEEFCGYVTPKNMKILRLLQSAIFRRQALLDGKNEMSHILNILNGTKNEFDYFKSDILDRVKYEISKLKNISNFSSLLVNNECFPLNEIFIDDPRKLDFILNIKYEEGIDKKIINDVPIKLKIKTVTDDLLEKLSSTVLNIRGLNFNVFDKFEFRFKKSIETKEQVEKLFSGKIPRTLMFLTLKSTTPNEVWDAIAKITFPKFIYLPTYMPFPARIIRQLSSYEGIRNWNELRGLAITPSINDDAIDSTIFRSKPFNTLEVMDFWTHAKKETVNYNDDYQITLCKQASNRRTNQAVFSSFFHSEELSILSIRDSKYFNDFLVEAHLIDIGRSCSILPKEIIQSIAAFLPASHPALSPLTTLSISDGFYSSEFSKRIDLRENNGSSITSFRYLATLLRTMPKLMNLELVLKWESDRGSLVKDLGVAFSKMLELERLVLVLTSTNMGSGITLENMVPVFEGLPENLRHLEVRLLNSSSLIDYSEHKNFEFHGSKNMMEALGKLTELNHLYFDFEVKFENTKNFVSVLKSLKKLVNVKLDFSNGCPGDMEDLASAFNENQLQFSFISFKNIPNSIAENANIPDDIKNNLISKGFSLKQKFY